MLNKCVQELFSSEEQQQHDFYIADTQGIAVWNGDRISVDLEGSGSGSEKTEVLEYEWTLMQYIKKYPSKARFFCVKKEKGLLLSLFCI